MDAVEVLRTLAGAVVTVGAIFGAVFIIGSALLAFDS